MADLTRFAFRMWTVEDGRNEERRISEKRVNRPQTGARVGSFFGAAADGSTCVGRPGHGGAHHFGSSGDTHGNHTENFAGSSAPNNVAGFHGQRGRAGAAAHQSGHGHSHGDSDSE